MCNLSLTALGGGVVFILIQSGDVELNPGPMDSIYQCDICELPQVTIEWKYYSVMHMISGITNMYLHVYVEL